MHWARIVLPRLFGAILVVIVLSSVGLFVADIAGHHTLAVSGPLTPPDVRPGATAEAPTK
jgi:hypothetical protein